VTISFANYREVPLQPDDSTAVKWRGIDVSCGWEQFQLTVQNVDAMNRRVNSTIKYSGESAGEDHWQSPRETLQLKTGDCEDFAILKFAILANSGIPDDDLRVVVGEIKKLAGNIQHAWCAARVDGRWLALDILFDFLTPIEDYSNWQPLYAMNQRTVTKYGLEIRLSDFIS
jgi:predicted transglutaminase-like cysteine proteinase